MQLLLQVGLMLLPPLLLLLAHHMLGLSLGCCCMLLKDTSATAGGATGSSVAQPGSRMWASSSGPNRLLAAVAADALQEDSNTQRYSISHWACGRPKECA
jgi:hypothetical protein